MTTSAPLNIPTPSGAVHLGDWELSDDERIAHRWFHCGERTTPGGLRIKVHGMQNFDGGVDGLSIAISDDRGDVTLDPEDVEHLVAYLPNATAQLNGVTAG